MDIDGESTDASHKKWTDGSGAETPTTDQPAPDIGGGIEGHDSSPAKGSPDGGSAPVNVGTIVLVGLMLLALAGAFSIATNNRKNAAPDADEIVFDAEEVSLDEGSVVLNARYTTADDDFFHVNGEDDMRLAIVKNDDTPDLYDVSGALDSMMKVGIDGMDKGQICTVEILHEVKYTFQGTFSSAACKFELSVTMAPSSSQLLAQGCSVDINLDPSAMYIAPRPENMVFTKSLERVSSEAFSFYIHDVALPRGVSCPEISNP